jgi:DNA replication protein DnaC
MKDKIYEYCKELRLSATFAENAVGFSGDTNQDYLLKVLQAEIDYRSNKRRNLHLKQAGFDNIKTFENYHFDKIIIPNTLTIDALKTLDFMQRQENLILYGRNGAGKTIWLRHLEWKLACEAKRLGSTRLQHWSTN